MSKICTASALVPLQSISPFKSYSDFNFKIAQKREILRENNVIFQFLKNLNIYLPMSYLSFFQLFNDFFLKNGAKFDTFSLIFEIQPPLLIRFSDAEIPIVYWGGRVEYKGNCRFWLRFSRMFGQVQPLSLRVVLETIIIFAY